MDKLKNFESFVKQNESNAVDREIKSRMDQDKVEEEEREHYIHNGELSKYLKDKGEKFTFGMLRAIFEDSLSAKKKRNIAKGGYKFIHRIVPIVVASLSPVLWLVGTIMGSLRAFNKIAKTALENPGNNYPEFLTKIIVNTMTIAEGEIKPLLGDDKFYRAFVVSDDITRIIRKDLLYEFATFLSQKMSSEPDDKEVPHKYIESELKLWLNDRYDLSYTFPTENK